MSGIFNHKIVSSAFRGGVSTVSRQNPVSINDWLGKSGQVGFKKLSDASHGKYNMGEIVVRNGKGGRLDLDLINHHVGARARQNTDVSTWQDRYRTNMAVFKAVLARYAGAPDEKDAVSALLDADLRKVDDGMFNGIHNPYVKEAFHFLLDKDSLQKNARPLSRDESACLFSLLDKGQAWINEEEDDDLPDRTDVVAKDMARLKDLRAFKAGEQAQDVRDLIRGFSVANRSDSESMRLRQVTVNQLAARIERESRDDGLARGREVLYGRMAKICNLVQERVIAAERIRENPDADMQGYARALTNGLAELIRTEVAKYNATVVGASNQIAESEVAAAVHELIADTVGPLLKGRHFMPGRGALVSDVDCLSNVIKRGIIRELDGLVGFPDGENEGVPLWVDIDRARDAEEERRKAEEDQIRQRLEAAKTKDDALTKAIAEKNEKLMKLRQAAEDAASAQRKGESETDSHVMKSSLAEENAVRKGKEDMKRKIEALEREIRKLEDDRFMLRSRSVPDYVKMIGRKAPLKAWLRFDTREYVNSFFLRQKDCARLPDDERAEGQTKLLTEFCTLLRHQLGRKPDEAEVFRTVEDFRASRNPHSDGTAARKAKEPLSLAEAVGEMRDFCVWVVENLNLSAEEGAGARWIGHIQGELDMLLKFSFSFETLTMSSSSVRYEDA